jgi:hypothetical protein
MDQQTKQRSLAAMPQEIAILDEILVHLNHGMHPLSGRPHDRGLNFLISLLLVRAFVSLRRAREDALCGYPVQSLALSRAALEDWGTCIYVEKNPDKRGLWLRGVLHEVEQEGQPPKFKTIWNEVSGGLGAQAREAYGVLSLFAHPRDTGLPWLYHWDPDTTYLHWDGHFEPKNLKVCLYFLVSISQMLLERVAQLQFRVLAAVDEQWLAEGLEISARAGKFMDQVHGETVRALDDAGAAGRRDEDDD